MDDVQTVSPYRWSVSGRYGQWWCPVRWGTSRAALAHGVMRSDERCGVSWKEILHVDICRYYLFCRGTGVEALEHTDRASAERYRVMR